MEVKRTWGAVLVVGRSIPVRASWGEPARVAVDVVAEERMTVSSLGPEAG